MTNTQRSRMVHLVRALNEACRAYYADTGEESPLTDRQYDTMLKELTALERVTGQRLPDSPTQRVGYIETPDKVAHIRPILSLKDTKSVDELLKFLGEEEGVLSWKLDGLSLVLHYSNGILQSALTRGDGSVGRDVGYNVLRIPNVPRRISYKRDIVVRGEGCLSLKAFDQIKNTKEGERFSNPRNLAAGIINTNNASDTLLRHMSFIAHSIVLIEGKGARLKKRSEQLDYLESLGFTVVHHNVVLNFELRDRIATYTHMVDLYEYPVDGLVLSLNDVDRAESLGSTAKYPKHSMAFKWPDEEKLTKVTGVKWSVSQTGLITPVVTFEPIEMDGTDVKQANLHSLKCFERLGLGVGDVVKICKANKIIPEVLENMTRSGTLAYPRQCPICGGETSIVQTERSKKLYCYYCAGKEQQ